MALSRTLLRWNRFPQWQKCSLAPSDLQETLLLFLKSSLHKNELENTQPFLVLAAIHSHNCAQFPTKKEEKHWKSDCRLLSGSISLSCRQQVMPFIQWETHQAFLFQKLCSLQQKCLSCGILLLFWGYNQCLNSSSSKTFLCFFPRKSVEIEIVKWLQKGLNPKEPFLVSECSKRHEYLC